MRKKPLFLFFSLIVIQMLMFGNAHAEQTYDQKIMGIISESYKNMDQGFSPYKLISDVVKAMPDEERQKFVIDIATSIQESTIDQRMKAYHSVFATFTPNPDARATLIQAAIEFLSIFSPIEREILAIQLKKINDEILTLEFQKKEELSIIINDIYNVVKSLNIEKQELQN